MSVRTAAAADAAAIQAIYAPEAEDGVATFETAAPTVEEMAARMAAVLPVYPWLVWDEAGEILGYAYASRHRDRAAYRWSVDVAVYVHPGARGRGVARGLYQRLLAILGEQGFHAAFAGVSHDNAGSRALHQACGFELVGVYREVGFKLGAWRDVGWWRKGLDDGWEAGSGQPGEPIPFAALRQGDPRQA